MGNIKLKEFTTGRVGQCGFYTSISVIHGFSKTSFLKYVKIEDGRVKKILGINVRIRIKRPFIGSSFICSIFLVFQWVNNIFTEHLLILHTSTINGIHITIQFHFNKRFFKFVIEIEHKCHQTIFTIRTEPTKQLSLCIRY